MTTPEHTSTPAEHDVRALGAVVAAAVVLVGLLVGVAWLAGTFVDLATWALATT
ncbi:hypothetical protein Cch01nite_29300 [Cellulomonas chitinilytica]|uniref:Uncharacterized protein n=1 Tax=Cellulomonas chitinilytica TaxID=398759 RepID=A0A919U2B8_9CELL|nr:hypothetical protein [Cellulomonas chitinilytica]GIG22206.1 hypothetical protein Cch01nite_29300 [Cellulomonas chitinilytica]